MAIWFHDVVYDSRGKENEERSAEVWHRVADSAGLDDPLRARVTDLILATKHAAPPIDSDAKLIVDVDLTILGQPAKRFDEYERQIRDEYAWVEPAAFTAGRGKVLTAFIKRGSIYFTEHFRAKYEAQARENLRRSLERLGRALSP